MQRVLIWDLPTRVFHWMLALSFAGAYFTCESEHMALCHVACGYTVGILIVFRCIWGLIGTRYARFSEFVFRPKTVIYYIAGLIRGRPARYVGHNPAGAIAILALLVLGLVCVASGWLLYDGSSSITGLEIFHEYAAWLMLAMVLVHIAGVLLSSLLHRENLVRSMVNGIKFAEGDQAIKAKHSLVAFLLFTGVLGFWLFSFRDAMPMVEHFAHMFSMLG